MQNGEKEIEKFMRAMGKQAEYGKLLQTLMEHSAEVYYFHDARHRLVYVSPNAAKVFGYRPKEMRVKWLSLATKSPINAEGLKITNRALKTGLIRLTWFLRR